MQQQIKYCGRKRKPVNFKLDIHIIGMQLGEGREETENYI